MEPEKKGFLPAGRDRRWDRYRLPLIVAALMLSILIHFGSYKSLGRFPVRSGGNARNTLKNQVKVRIVEKSKTQNRTTKKKNDAKKILEAKQIPTEPPKKPAFLGHVDHRAEKDMRLPNKMPLEKAKDPGPQGTPHPPASQVTGSTHSQPKMTHNAPEAPEKKPLLTSSLGNISIQKDRKNPRNVYESLLPSQAADLPGQLNAGFQDHLDEDLPVGDRIDLNTSEYRYIGYFTAMRKAIELVWNYPPEASRRGLQGEVSLEFAIGKDGRTSHIRVLKSSGYEILDRAIISAIKLASPFAPLPQGFGKNKLVITGSFRYILGPYSAH